MGIKWPVVHAKAVTVPGKQKAKSVVVAGALAGYLVLAGLITVVNVILLSRNPSCCFQGARLGSVMTDKENRMCGD